MTPMSPDKLPEWLYRAQEKFKARGPLRVTDQWPFVPEPGEFRIVESMDPGGCDSRVAVVISCDKELGILTVALTSNDLENATDRDFLVRSEDSSLPFDLLIEGDMVGTVWTTQATQLLAPVRVEVRNSLGRFLSSAQVPAGLPVKGPADPRWRHKEKDLDNFQALTGDCTAWIAEGASMVATVLDPQLLSLSDCDDELDAMTRLCKVLDTTQDGGALVSPGVLRILEKGGSFTADAYSSALSLDAWNALEQLRERALLPSSQQGAPIGNYEFRPSRRSSGVESMALAVAIGEAAAEGPRCVRLRTSPEFWTVALVPTTNVLSFRSHSSGSIQVLAETAEAE
jgi:hypothetical protein